MLFACGRRGEPRDGLPFETKPLERVVLEHAPDEEAIRLGRGRYVATLTRSEFVGIVGWDVPPGSIVPIEVRNINGIGWRPQADGVAA